MPDAGTIIILLMVYCLQLVQQDSARKSKGLCKWKLIATMSSQYGANRSYHCPLICNRNMHNCIVSIFVGKHDFDLQYHITFIS
ncbi:unnamed protein product [Albugo candida]|uniref:Secreted protein n=1 Tax=Albugo candida TaxID=65357 RepID=A0A024GEU5_9STRA|nr:unnamed protein product [Albugo candida]CCI45222.1 unnamed protein product [Albugo candida]|eukprot:CCI11452.1 unnamed protein product [Albugo candida]